MGVTQDLFLDCLVVHDDVGRVVLGHIETHTALTGLWLKCEKKKKQPTVQLTTEGFKECLRIKPHAKLFINGDNYVNVVETIGEEKYLAWNRKLGYDIVTRTNGSNVQRSENELC